MPENLNIQWEWVPVFAILLPFGQWERAVGRIPNYGYILRQATIYKDTTNENSPYSFEDISPIFTELPGSTYQALVVQFLKCMLASFYHYLAVQFASGKVTKGDQ